MLGLWLRLGFIGVLAPPAGLLALAEGQVEPLFAFALAAGGAGLAMVSWQRVRSLLDVVDGAVAVTAGASSPADSASGGRATPPPPAQGRRSETILAAAPHYAAPRPELSS